MAGAPTWATRLQSHPVDDAEDERTAAARQEADEEEAELQQAIQVFHAQSHMHVCSHWHPSPSKADIPLAVQGMAVDRHAINYVLPADGSLSQAVSEGLAACSLSRWHDLRLQQA